MVRMRLTTVVLAGIFFLPQLAQAQSQLARFADSLLQTVTQPRGPGISVLIAEKGNVVFEHAYGLADSDIGKPMADSMVFPIASNTKQFTAICILQLLEKGKLGLEDSLGAFMPCIPPRGGICIRELLAQTSGLGDRLDSPMRAVPGSRWEYNNENYELLGKIIEKVSGLPYSVYLDRHIFGPAGMKRSFIEPDSKAFSAGGIQSTLEDMLLWNRALLAGKLVSSSMLQLAFTSQMLKGGQATAYGFGWRVGELQGSPLLWHGGLLPGYESQTLYLPMEDVYLVIFHHPDSSAVPLHALGMVMGAAAIGKPYRWTALPMDADFAALFTGVYTDPAGFLLNVSLENGRLFFQRANGHKYAMLYAGGQDFFFEKDFIRIRFGQDLSGKISSLSIGQVGLFPIEWKKTTLPLQRLAPEPPAAAVLAKYTGNYRLPSGDTLVVTRKGPNLILHLPGKSGGLLIAESDRLFFAGGTGIQVEFDQTAQGLALTGIGPKEVAVKIPIRNQDQRF